MTKHDNLLKMQDSSRKLEPGELAGVTGGMVLSTGCPYKNDGEVCTGSPYTCHNAYENKVVQSGYCTFG